jgi:hypothetical protein
MITAKGVADAHDHGGRRGSRGGTALAGVVYLAVLTRGFRRPTPQLAVDHTP